MNSRPRILSLIVALILVANAAEAQRQGRPLVDDVVRAMGGDRMLSISTLVLEGDGATFNLGQNLTPYAPLPMFAVTEYRRSIDFGNKRWRQELMRAPRFLAGNTAAQRLRTGYDSVAFDILADGTLRRGASSADIDRANELMYHPIGFLQAAVAAGTELTEERSQAGLRHLNMNVQGNKFAMFVDRKTRLPVRIEKVVYQSMLGDVILATEFANWRTVDGLVLPSRIVQRLDKRWLLSDLHMSKITPNLDVGDIRSTPAIRASAAPAPVVTVTEELIAPGIWYLAGQSHHSVLVEMRDHMLLVEAPQNEARTLAVIQKARAMRPSKPLSSVINTHHHFDHAGGLRAAIVEGLAVITHSGNKAFFEDIAKRRHSMVRDSLAKTRRTAHVRGVGPKTVLSDGTRSVEIHQIPGSKHAETLLMIYLPAEKLLIQADVYSPPAANATTAPSFPFAANLVQNIDRLGLDVERLVPIHGRVVPMSELRAAVRAP